MTNKERIEQNNAEIAACLELANKIPIPQEKEVTVNENGVTEILPDDGRVLSKVTLTTEVAGGGVELNIAYGDTAPEDTSKLWCKTSEPSGVIVSPTVKYGGEDDEVVVPLSTTIPTAANGIAAAAVGTKIYLFGGYTGSSRLKTISRFDTETETISTLSTTIPTAANGIAAAAVGTKIYLFGGSIGSTYTATIYRFDTETETISTLSTVLPTGTNNMGVASVGTKIYLFGGNQGSGVDYLKTINCFDTETETITTLDITLPTTLTDTSCAVIGDKVYLLGGKSGNSWGAQTLSTVYCFDAESTFVTTCAKMPSYVNGAACSSSGTRIYLFGGIDTYDSVPYNRVWCYDTETQSTTALPTTLPTAVTDLAAAAVGTKIYLFGGYTGSSRLNTICLFNSLGVVLAANTLQLVLTDSVNLFDFINTSALTAQIGVSKVYKGKADGYGEEVKAALYKNGAWTII